MGALERTSPWTAQSKEISEKSLQNWNGLLEKKSTIWRKRRQREGKLLAAESERQQEALSNKIEAEKNRQPVAVTALMAGVSAAMTDKTLHRR